MADTKISALTDGTTAEATDKIPVERSGANRYITPDYIISLAEGSNNVWTGVNTFQPGIDGQAGTFRRNSSGQSANIIDIQTEANASLAYVDKDGGIGAKSVILTDVANPPSPTLAINGGTNITGTTLSGVQITGTGGQFSCDATELRAGQLVTISGGISGTGSISGYSNPTTYRISETNGSTTFTLIQERNGAAVTTTAGTPTGVTYTLSSAVLRIDQTWNNSAVVFNGLRLNITNTASQVTSRVFTVGVNNSTIFRVESNGSIESNGIITAGSNIVTNGRVVSFGSTTFLRQDDLGDTLAQRNGTNPQTFRVYRTYTDASNYERGFTRWNSNVFEVGTEAAGTGTARALSLVSGTGTTVIGGSDAASPVAQTISVQNVAAGTTNAAGANLTILGSAGTGTGTGGSIIFRTANAGSSGSSQNSYVTVMTLLEGTPYAGQWTAGTSNTTFSAIYGSSMRLNSNCELSWCSVTNAPSSANKDLILVRDAAAVLAQRNSTNAQTFRVYNTFTDASNYQRMAFGWNTSTALMMNEGAGTGADGSVAFNDAALATDATKGFLMIPSCAGAPTGTPADIPTGQIPIVFDSTNNQLYVYDGGWLKTAALT